MTVALDCMALAADERRDLAALLDSLTPDQWASPSLCTGWSVRDVVAHRRRVGGGASRPFSARRS